ncbi:unnamed protein product [Caenorhabditis auriculariae]|uniref:G-protein coupled receptors family 1 profile domain-containing protein n=1 Tax=Caenorhabditis auriculariae TaxID=2777116 RepID=A0A8S1GPW1_9PELO|nr:unnamed protein product [Caenorhabditis auriculariae]
MLDLDPQELVRSCAEQFGKKLDPVNCIQAIASIDVFESRHIEQCSSDTDAPYFRHIMNFSAVCNVVEIMYLQYVVPPLMFLCLMGNVLNLLIYSLAYFDGSSSVHFLRAKAIFNMIFVFSRVFEVLHASSPQAISWLETLFWKTRPYMMMISNISGTMSTWLTLMVTMETVMCILMPFVFRQYCTKRLTWIFLAISLLISTLLHFTIVLVTDVQEVVQIRPFAHRHDPNSTCWFVQTVFHVRNNPDYEMWRRFYATITMAVSIVIPTVAMLVCTILIIKQFTFKELGEAFSQRRKCVIRMTVATTLSHLLLEGPATLTHAASAVQGEDYSLMLCVLNHGNNLLSLVNATIPFFVFLLYNEQFRHMTCMYLKALMQTDKAKRKAFLSQAAMRCGRVSRVETERSFVETRLYSKGSNV